MLNRTLTIWLFLESVSISSAPAQERTRFAVIGNYGYRGFQYTASADVASLVKGWSPEFIVTVGDNNPPDGSAATIDRNVGMNYSEFIYPYSGIYGTGDTVNRFFPTLGDLDWFGYNYAQPYRDYFVLPGNERYYDITRGHVRCFILSSDNNEPDGNRYFSTQALMLQTALAASTAKWNLIFLHHAPYSSGPHGPQVNLHWPFKAWGATAVIAGSDMVYERLQKGGLTYFVNGLGGYGYHALHTTISGSQIRFTAEYGAMRIEANAYRIVFEFITRNDSLVDRYIISDSALVHVPLAVEAGWNLISLPLLPPDSSVRQLFPDALSRAHRFDPGGYTSSDVISPRRGYWLKFSTSTELIISGHPTPIDSLVVTMGWNLVSGPSAPLPVTELRTDPPGLLSSGIFGFSEQYQMVDSLHPAKAYWVKCTGPGMIYYR